MSLFDLYNKASNVVGIRKAPNWRLQGATIMPIPDDAVYDPVCQRFQLVASQSGVTPESLADALQETSKKLAQGDCDE